MYIAMNRFQVRKGYEEEFERVWKSRDTYLSAVPGFREFHLLRGPEHEEYTLYSSHSLWDSREAFEAWTRSEAFRKAHASAGGSREMYLDRPHFEGFEVIQRVGA